MIGRAFGRNALADSFKQIFGPGTRPSESALDDFWSLIENNDGPRILHKLIAYIPQRRQQRERWVAAMQRGEVPLRVIDGEVDPISGGHMVALPRADSGCRHGIAGQYRPLPAGGGAGPGAQALPGVSRGH